MSNDDRPSRRPPNPMGRKPRVPVGPRHGEQDIPHTRHEGDSYDAGPTLRDRRHTTGLQLVAASSVHFSASRSMRSRSATGTIM